MSPETLPSWRQQHDAQAILPQRAALSSSHAHHCQNHKTTLLCLEEKIAALDGGRKNADLERRNSVYVAQQQYETAIKASDDIYNAAIEEAAPEKERLNQQRHEEIERYKKWEHAANETHVAINKKLSPTQPDTTHNAAADTEHNQQPNN